MGQIRIFGILDKCSPTDPYEQSKNGSHMRIKIFPWYVDHLSPVVIFKNPLGGMWKYLLNIQYHFPFQIY